MAEEPDKCFSDLLIPDWQVPQNVSKDLVCVIEMTQFFIQATEDRNNNSVKLSLNFQ